MAENIRFNISDKMICRCCKKPFYSLDFSQWAYKIVENQRVKYYCSWSCLNKARKKKEEKKNDTK